MSDTVIPRSVRRNHWMNHVATHAAMRPEATAFKYLGNVTTWGQFHDRVQHLAAALQRRGVRFGDRVMMLTLNSTDVLEAVFAINTLGAMAVPINIRLTPPEIAFIIDDADADIIIVDGGLQDMPCVDFIRQAVAIYPRHRPQIMILIPQFDLGAIMRAKRAGAVGFLMKPFNRSQLLDRFRQLATAA